MSLKKQETNTKNKTMKERSIKKLRVIAETVIEGIDMQDEEFDSCELINEINSAITPYVREYAEELIASGENPEEGWVFLGDIDLFLVKISEGKYIPSVVSPEWEAKANSIDPTCAVSAVDALAWGLSEALAYKLAEELVNEPVRGAKQPNAMSIEDTGELLGLIAEAIDELRNIGCDDIASHIETQAEKVIKQHKERGAK